MLYRSRSGICPDRFAAACLEGRPHLAVAMDAKGRDSVTAFWFALAKLAAAGYPLDTDFAWRNYAVEPISPQCEDIPMAIPITGSNYGKKYPGKNESIARANALRRTRPNLRLPYSTEQFNIACRVSNRFIAQMAEAHAATQRALSESHLAYLRASEAAFAQLGAERVPAANYGCRPRFRSRSSAGDRARAVAGRSVHGRPPARAAICPSSF